MTQAQRKKAIRDAKLAVQRLAAEAFECGRLAEQMPPEYHRRLASVERQMGAVFKRLERLA